jgi:hypothetical protein
MGRVNLQNAPVVSAVAAFIGGLAVMLLAGLGVLEAAVIAILIAIVAYLVTSWQTGRIRR